MEEVLLTVEEAARRTNLSRSKFYEMVKIGEVRAIRVAGQLRVPVAEISAWLTRKLSEGE